jgi:hypothetical protein
VTDLPDPPDSPDLADQARWRRVVAEGDPVDAASELAASMDAEVADGPDDAAAAVARRLAAAESVAGSPVAVSPNQIARVRKLAGELARAERIRTRTEVEFTEALSRRLSRGTGLAVHPEALYSAARAVTDAKAARDAADEALAALGPPPDATTSISAPIDVGDSGPEPYDEAALERRRDRVFTFGVIVAAIGLAILLAIFVHPLIALAPLLLAVPVILVALRRARNARAEAADRRLAASSLAAAAATADHATAAVAKSRDAIAGWTEQTAALEARRESAVERLRAAQRAWETLAGPEADAHDVESVVAARDAQFQLTGTSAEASPTMRTVNAYLRRAAARWKVLWATLGWDEPPPSEEIDGILAGFAVQADARALLATPLVLVEPFDTIDEDQRERLERDLAALPADADVVVVVAAAAEVELND